MRNGTASPDVFDTILAKGSAADDTADAAEDTTINDDADDSSDKSEEVADDARTKGASDSENTDLPTSSDGKPVHSKRRRLIRVVTGTLAALIFLAAVGLAGFFGWKLKQQDDAAAAGRAALDIARTYAVTLTSVDNATIDSNFTQVLNGATGEFKDMYSQSAAQLRQLLIDNKAVSHGTVVDAAVKSATPTKVEVLIFVDQSISNSANPQPRIDRSRVAITMEKIDNRWLASKVDIK